MSTLGKMLLVSTLLFAGCSYRKDNIVCDDAQMEILSAKKFGDRYIYIVSDGKHNDNKDFNSYGWELETDLVFHVGDIITITKKENE